MYRIQFSDYLAHVAKAKIRKSFKVKLYGILGRDKGDG